MRVNTDERAAIIDRMRELRSTGMKDVSKLHVQAGRVTDWREHVRAHPEVSMIAASIVGFSLVRKLANGVPPTQPIHYAPPGSVAKQSASMGLLSVAGGMAASLARQWVTEYIRKQVGLHTHATTNQSTYAGQRSHSNS